jgi:hypothetical protein
MLAVPWHEAKDNMDAVGVSPLLWRQPYTGFPALWKFRVEGGVSRSW